MNFGTAANAENGLLPVNLQAEYQTEPLGIGTKTPRLSWKFVDPNFTQGQKQTAYQILIASSETLLSEENADVWNSGKIESEQSLLVPYSGKNELQTSREYFWKVQIFDKDGKSSWSKPARFVTGLLNSSDWNDAEWIKYPHQQMGLQEDDPRVRDERERLQKMFDEGKKEFLVSELAKPVDPALNVLKTLEIEYETGGKTYHWKGTDKDQLRLNFPSVKIVKAKYGPPAKQSQHIWFRKNLHLDNAPQAIFAHVASLGHHELYINGQKVDESVLAPALTDFQKRLFYVTYDVSKLLKKGDNTIAVWFAPGWAIYDCFQLTPLLKVKINGLDAAKNSVTLNSDATWRCAISNSEDTESITSFNQYGGEIVDARKENPDWNKTGFDDSQWQNAVTQDFNVELTPQDIPASRLIEKLPAKAINKVGDGKYQIDFGKNFSGWVNIKFHGLASGDKITMGSADDDKSFCDFNIRNFFISSGKDGETFQNRFNYVAGRYLNLEGLKQPPKLEDATAYALSTGLKRTGHFKSSNELFNKIYETDIWTFLSNTQEGYTSDCPHRERCGYGEVATACSWGLGLPNFDTGAYYRKVVRDWTDVQTEDGWGRHVAPQPNSVHWGGAMWSSAGMNVAEHHYQHYGDIEIIKLIYPTAQRWLAFLEANSKDKLLRQYRKENNGHFLGDWLTPGSRQDFGTSKEALFFNNCVYVMNLETMIRFAKLLNKQEDVEKYNARLTELKQAIQATFYDTKSNNYMSGWQVQNAFPLLVGITPESERAKVAANIHNDLNGKHPFLDMGSSGLTVLLKYLIANPEEGETVAKILNKTEFPGYGYFVAEGESTWPEDWKINVPSKIHTCYTGIASWFIKGLCGIQPDTEKPGYKHFIIRPMIVDEVTFAEASVESPYGQIFARWERSNGKIKLTVIIPPNTTATVYMNKKPQEVQAGKYEFKW